MASRSRALTLGAGALAAALVALVLGSAAAVAWRGGGVGLGPADWSAVRFTVLQAALSACLASGLAIPVARALARRRFAGRGALIALMGAPFLLPVVVAVLGLLAVFGREGVLNDGLAAIGLPPVRVFGLHGVVLAHVFLNLPFAVRMLLLGWQAIPAERYRLAASLGMGPGAQVRHLEVPMLRAVLPGAALVIFLLCLTSFAVALTLAGGPRATTVELAIYQAVRFDFDLPRAAALAGVQFALCAVAVTLTALVAVPTAFGAGLDRALTLAAPGGWRRGADAVWVTLAALFLLVPLGAVLLRGVPGLADLPVAIWAATARSVGVALASAALAVAGALVLALAVARGARWIEGAAMLPMAASGLVLGCGLFLIVQPVIRPDLLALPVTVAVNASLALPFVFRLILPHARALHSDYGRLQRALGLRGWAGLRLVTLPRLRQPLGFGAGVAAALSMGDLGVIALFAGDNVTLPLLVQRLMASYQMATAAAAALVLVVLSFGLFWVCDRWGRHAAA